MQSRTLMEWVLRIMANLLRPDELGPAEAAYKMVVAQLPSPPSRRPLRTPEPSTCRYAHVAVSRR